VEAVEGRMTVRGRLQGFTVLYGVVYVYVYCRGGEADMFGRLR
jgi:hypothetical protein